MRQDDKALLLRLQEQNLEFVIIGGLCSVLHGVSLVTLDLDICCAFTRENLRRIEKAVSGFNPRHRLASNKLPGGLASFEEDQRWDAVHAELACETSALLIASHVSGRTAPMFACSVDFFGDVIAGCRREKPRITCESLR